MAQFIRHVANDSGKISWLKPFITEEGARGPQHSDQKKWGKFMERGSLAENVENQQKKKLV